jgi:hypothetical protein
MRSRRALGGLLIELALLLLAGETGGLDLWSTFDRWRAQKDTSRQVVSNSDRLVYSAVRGRHR